jgi:tetratricopeptide (TPR) repeat protein
LVDDERVTPEVLEKRFENYKGKGIEAFAERRFGDAHQALSKALEVREDKDVYLYLAYTQSSLGEDEEMVKTLEQGIMAFPYEVRLYQTYVKYLAANGQKEKALALLEKAIKMNPEDQNLLFMRQYVDAMGE